MTIPTRPAPAPPTNIAQNAAAGANASLEQLRRVQFEQAREAGSTSKEYHHQHHHLANDGHGDLAKLTIKLPPPSKKPNAFNSNGNNHQTSNGSSITRKFPKARYAPATNWDDSPFETTSTETSMYNGGGFKKVPPPRPPPPQVQRSNTTTSLNTAPTSIINNIFHRMKNVTAKGNNTNNNVASRVYGVSSGNTNTSATTSQSIDSSLSSTATGISSWTSSWDAPTTAPTCSISTAAETQLISFDSPPSSPTLTQKSNSDCVSVDSFSSESNFSSPHNGNISQPESGFEDDFSGRSCGGIASRPPTTSPLDPWEASATPFDGISSTGGGASYVGTAPVRNWNSMSNGSNDNPLCNGRSLLPPPTSLAVPTIIKPKIAQKPRAPKPPPQLIRGQWPTTDRHMTGMPLGPPPPLPPTGAVSVLDVIAGKVDALQLHAGGGMDGNDDERPYGIALYDFEGIEADDLNFRENDKILLLEQINGEWYRGRTRNGCEGIFPINYIDIKVGLQPTTHAAATMIQQPPPVKLLRACCMYNFKAQFEGDLELKENDMVNILYRINEDWLYGEIDCRQGQFPANFLDNLPANIPTMP